MTAVFDFARAANCKVIYTVRLKDSSPEKVAPIAKYLMDHYAPLISCIAIGNEPNMYAKDLLPMRPALTVVCVRE